MNYREIVDYIEEIPKFTSKNPLDHTKALLKCLGDPQNQMQVIHVAGTNGKGSVCAYLDSMLRAGGYKVGLFTSPHLVKINERFKINGEMISDERFVKAFEEVQKIIKKAQEDGLDHPSYFETLFLMGMVVFKEAVWHLSVRSFSLQMILNGTGGHTCSFLFSRRFPSLQFL